MSEPPTVRVENQLIRFVPPFPIELDVAVNKLGAIRQDDFAVHTLATPRATIIVDKEGKVLKGEAQGRLCISQSWPGQMRTVYGDHKRFIDTYFSQFDGKYFTGDGCRRDKDGYYWITGRVDDVIIVSGHNLGTAEIESAFVAHPKVAEAAVVGYPHAVSYTHLTLPTKA